MVGTEFDYGSVQDLTLLKNSSNSYNKERINILKKIIRDTNKKVEDNSIWYVIQLAEIEEIKNNPYIIDDAIKKVFGDSVNVFIPCYRERIEDSVTAFWLFDGYVFIEANEKVYNNFFFSSENNYVLKKILLNKSYKVKEISGKEINELKRKLWDLFCKSFPKKGDIIVPIIGSFSGYQGKVINVYKRDLIAIVSFVFSTRRVDVPISFINCGKVDYASEGRIL